MTPTLKMPLAITRCALLTPLDRPGALGRSTWEALRAGESVGAATAVADELLDPDTSLDRSLRLALAVAREAGGGLSPDTALFCGTSKGPVGTFLAALRALGDGRPLTESIARQVALGVGAVGTIVAERLGLSAGHTSVAACASGLHALHRAAQALRRGECERALVVAADASLHPLFEASFQRLGVLAPADAQGVRRCEPFGAAGEGFFLVEAAAALLLERSPPLPPSPASTASLATLEESWIGADATGLIAIDERTQGLRAGLARCTAPDLAFVHAHATGTAHDAYELAALRDAAGPGVPIFSHKGHLGHSLGAAGLVSVALSVECHRHRRTLAGDPIPAGAPSLTIAQGFGGHIAIARLRGAD